MGIPATTGRVREAMTAWKKTYALGPETDVGRAAKDFMERYGVFDTLKEGPAERDDLIGGR